MKKLGNKIINSEFNPTMIAAVPRGGWCVAALLAQVVGVKKTIGISSEKLGGNIKIYLSSMGDLTGERVLLVEDSIETGNTLFSVEKELIKMGAEVRTVAIFASSVSKQEKSPDFFLDSRVIPNFPWEL